MKSLINSLKESIVLTDVVKFAFNKDNMLELLKSEFEKLNGDGILFCDAKFVEEYKPSNITRFGELSETFAVETFWQYEDVKEGGMKDISMTIHFPELRQDGTLLIRGTEYMFPPSFAKMGDIVTDKKIILKDGESLFILELNTLRFTNKVGFFETMIHWYHLNDKTIDDFIHDFSGGDCKLIKEPSNKNSELLYKMKDYYVKFKAVMNTKKRLMIEKGLKRMKLIPYNLIEDPDPEVFLKRVAKTRRLRLNVESHLDVITKRGSDEIIKMVLNPKKTDEFEKKPITYELLVYELMLAMRRGKRVITLNKIPKTFFNKRLYENLILSANRFQYNDITSSSVNINRCILTNQTGYNVKVRSVHLEYKRLLGLFFTTQGKSVGTVSEISPVF